MAGIPTNDIFSEDTQRMLEGFNQVILSSARIESLLGSLATSLEQLHSDNVQLHQDNVQLHQDNGQLHNDLQAIEAKL